jgi:DNA ligase-associated metallophosphoesterase
VIGILAITFSHKDVMMLTPSTSTGHELVLSGQTLQLLPRGAAYWKEGSTLFVADLHLGKSTAFRRNGIPIPQGASERTLVDLQECVQSTRAQRLIVLGDFVHAKCGWDDSLVQDIQRFLFSIPHTELIVVEGNHDRGSRRRLDQIGISMREEPMLEPICNCFHDPNAFWTSTSAASSYAMAGHLHPSIRLGASWGDRVTLPCFWFVRHCLVLPAFGKFTGTKPIVREPGDQVFAIAENEVIALESAATSLASRSRR